MKKELEALLQDLSDAEREYDRAKPGSMLKKVHEASRKVRRLLDKMEEHPKEHPTWCGCEQCGGMG